MPTVLQNGFTLYTAEEMPNEMYHHEVGGVSGTGLCKIFLKSPAHYRYGEQTTSPALTFGIASHAAVLEKEAFDAEFVCDIERKDYPDALNSDVEMKAKLKELGVSGFSKLKKPELIEALKKTGEDIQFWPEIYAEFEAEHEGKTLVKKADYENIMKMRNTIFGQKKYAEILTGGHTEMSIVGEIELPSGRKVLVKIRPDYVSEDFQDVDYKTCLDASREKFGRDAYKLGYYLKMAMRHDILEMAFGKKPKHMMLLAQEKTSPYIPQGYVMTDRQLELGRRQYIEALEIYAKCMETGIWPSYSSHIEELETCYDASKEMDALEI
ncbi:exonuclease VIII [Vibrio phage D81]